MRLESANDAGKSKYEAHKCLSTGKMLPSANRPLQPGHCGGVASLSQFFTRPVFSKNRTHAARFLMWRTKTMLTRAASCRCFFPVYQASDAFHIGNKGRVAISLFFFRHAQKKRRMNGDEAGAAIQNDGPAVLCYRQRLSGQGQRCGGAQRHHQFWL